MAPARTRNPRGRALVATLVPVGDSRPSKHVSWLESAGYQVDVLSTGAPHPEATGRHLTIAIPSLPLRLGAYAGLPNRARFDYLAGSRIPEDAVPPADRKYDVVVVHELDLLPWFIENAGRLTDGPVLLDLGEYFGSHGIGLGYRLLFERYHRWLLGMVPDPVFTARTTVSEGIAELYARNLDIPVPGVTLNVTQYAALRPSAVNEKRVRLIHHGRSDLGRGLELMLDAMMLVDDRFQLSLMLIGTDRELGVLRRHPAVAAGRVEFLPPVPMAEVSAAINHSDAEIIFFPPKTENLRHVLPNKLFEAIQGRLGIVAGPSPELVTVIEEAGNGVIAAGWSAQDLADAISSLDVPTLRRFKRASNAVARRFSDTTERGVFLQILGQTADLPRPV